MAVGVTATAAAVVDGAIDNEGSGADNDADKCSDCGADTCSDGDGVTVAAADTEGLGGGCGAYELAGR